LDKKRFIDLYNEGIFSVYDLPEFIEDAKNNENV